MTDNTPGFQSEQVQPPRSVAIEMPKNKPVVTYSLLAVTILVFLLQLAGRSLLGFDIVGGIGMKVNDLILAGQVWRLITPMFLHSTSLYLHILFNMYALFSFGPTLERFYGHGRFLMLYFLAGLAGNVLSFIFSPVASLGASTAVFGLVGAEAVFLYQNKKIFGRQVQNQLINLIVIVLLNLFIGASSGIVDNWGHIGGLIGGVIFAWFGGPLLQVGGMYPDLRIVDSRSARQSYIVGGMIALACAGLALASALM